MDRDVFLIGALCSILLFGIWWAYIRPEMKNSVMDTSQPILVQVIAGKFSPAIIHVPRNHQLTLHFYREDQASAASTVFFPELHAVYDLPLQQKVEVIIPPIKSGKLSFKGQHDLYNGTIMTS